MATKIYRAQDLPIKRDLVCRRGDTLRSPFYRHKDPVTGLARDLTGCTITCTGTLSNGSAVDLTPYLILNLIGGRYRLIVPPAVTNGATPWPSGLGSYVITVTDPLGVVTSYFYGDLGLKEAA